jgi:uncharacterized Zn-finger protein
MSGLGNLPQQRPQEMTLKRTWKVEVLDEGDALITCGNCKNAAIVHLKTWLTFSEFKTRTCTYCYRTGKFPPPYFP